MSKPKTLIFSETYENWTIDTYINNKDHGPWYEVIEKSAYDKAIEALKFYYNCLKTDIELEGFHTGFIINDNGKRAQKTLKELGELD